MKHQKMRYLSVFLALCAIVGAAAGEAAGGTVDTNATATSEPRLREYLQAQRHVSKAPSISVAVGVDGKIVVAEAVGFADVDQEIRASTATQYRTYSITKAITAVAIMKLWERGQISLDDDVRDYVPAFPHSVPVINLLTHTSGIRHYKENAGEISSTREYASLSDAIGIFKDDPLEFEPGMGYRYSSFGFQSFIRRHRDGVRRFLRGLSEQRNLRTGRYDFEHPTHPRHANRQSRTAVLCRRVA